MDKPPLKGPRYTDLVASLPDTVPFVDPETDERGLGHAFAARLGANENVFGPSPEAVAAMRVADTELWKYGTADSYDLKNALAAHYGIHTENIVVGEGIDGLLGYLVRLLVGPGDRVVTSHGAYPTFNYHVAAYGGDIVTVPFNGNYEDPAALVAKAAAVGAKLIYLANPDNPMGTVHDAATIEAAINAVPDGAVLVLDEAYAEFAPSGTAPAFDTDDTRVIRMRTFSKAYGLAGVRVGYAIGHMGLIKSFDKIRNHFGLGRSGQIGALAALRDQAYLAEVLAKVAVARDRISKVAVTNGLEPISSATNFVTMDCSRDADFAKAVVDDMARRGVFIRRPFVAPYTRCIRVSAGRGQDLDVFEAALPLALKACG
ncbi:MAG: pyridoxal phosphate-dependent aminotransferase [Rhodobacterales bacterium]